MEITKYTKLEDLVPSDDITSDMQTLNNTIGTIIDERSSTIETHMGGALSADKLVDGNAAFYNTATTVSSTYNRLSTSLETIAISISGLAVSKEIEELEELKTAVTKAISECETNYETYTTQKASEKSEYRKGLIQTSINNTLTEKQRWEEKLDRINARLSELGVSTDSGSGSGTGDGSSDTGSGSGNGNGSGNGSDSGDKSSTDSEKDSGDSKDSSSKDSTDKKDSTNKESTNGETHSKGDKVNKDGTNYTVIGYVTDDDGKSYGIYEDSMGNYYYYDKDGNKQRVKAVTKLTIPTKDGDTLERNANNESEDSLVYQDTGETFEGYKIGDKVYKPSDISSTGSDSSGTSAGNLKWNSHEYGTVTNPDTGKTTTIYEDSNGWYYYIDENGNQQNVKANMITDSGEQVQKLASDESTQGINDLNYKETFDSYEIDGQKYTADQVNTNVKGITIDNAQVGDKFEYNGTNYKVKTGTVNGTTQNVYDAGIFGGYYYKDDSGNLVKIREAAPGEYVTE